MPTLAHWPVESQNCHVLRTLILSCQIFRTDDNYSAVWLLHVAVIICFSFYDDFCNYTGKEKRYKVWAKIQLFCYFVKYISNPYTKHYERGSMWWYITWKVLNMKNFRISDPLTTHWSWPVHNIQWHNVLEWCISSKTDTRTYDTLVSTSVSILLHKVGLTTLWFWPPYR